LLEPLVKAIGRYALGTYKIHADDTPVPVLFPGRGTTKQGRLWTYVRDDRPAGSAEPAAVFFVSARIAKVSGLERIWPTSLVCCRRMLMPASINSTARRSRRQPAGRTYGASSTTSIKRFARRSHSRPLSGSGLAVCWVRRRRRARRDNLHATGHREAQRSEPRELSALRSGTHRRSSHQSNRRVATLEPPREDAGAAHRSLIGPSMRPSADGYSGSVVGVTGFQCDSYVPNACCLSVCPSIPSLPLLRERFTVSE
jgi:hypothetical protein